jgi:spore coat polysaccharide biosynthesis protein SpsF
MDSMVTAVQTIGVIQARIGSDRLHAKVLAPLVEGQPLLSALCQRLSSASIEWWLATTDQRADDVTAAWGRELGLNVYRGDEHDVLSRFAAIASSMTCEWIVRVTADDPFVDGSTVQRLAEAVNSAPDDVDIIGDLPSNRHFPLGYLPQIVRSAALLRLQRDLPSDDYHRAHVTSALIPHRAAPYRDARLPARPRWRWTVDTLEDLQMAQAAFSTIGPEWKHAEYVDFVQLLDARPDIVAINRHVRQKALKDG